MMGKVAPPPPEARLEKPDESLSHDTVLVELSRAVRAVFDADRVDELLLGLERALGSRSVGGESVTPQKGRNAACPRCKAALWIPPAPVASDGEGPAVADAVRARRSSPHSARR